MAELKKGDRVRYIHPKDGAMLGVIGKVSKAKSYLSFIPDGSWDKGDGGWSHSSYGIGTAVKIPGRLEIVSDPLPLECQIPADDPVLVAGFTGKVTGVCEANEGYAYNLKVLYNGRDSHIRLDEAGSGGSPTMQTYGAYPEVVKKFEDACEAWATHFGVLGPHRQFPAWEVWMGHEFGLDELKKLGGNFPIALAAKPEPWDFTFKEDEELVWDDLAPDLCL